MTAFAKYAKIIGILLIAAACYFAWGAWNDIQHRLDERDALITEKAKLLKEQQQLQLDLQASRDLLKTYAQRADMAANITAQQATDLERLQREITAIRNRNDAKVTVIKQTAIQANKPLDQPEVVAAVSSQRLQSLWETYCLTSPHADLCK